MDIDAKIPSNWCFFFSYFYHLNMHKKISKLGLREPYFWWRRRFVGWEESWGAWRSDAVWEASARPPTASWRTHPLTWTGCTGPSQHHSARMTHTHSKKKVIFTAVQLISISFYILIVLWWASRLLVTNKRHVFHIIKRAEILFLYGSKLHKKE